MTTVHVHYFAGLQRKAGKAMETLQADVGTPAELWDVLQLQYGWEQKRAHCAVAINDRFGKWDASLRDGDKVVFLTPVSGG